MNQSLHKPLHTFIQLQINKASMLMFLLIYHFMLKFRFVEKIESV